MYENNPFLIFNLKRQQMAKLYKLPECVCDKKKAGLQVQALLLLRSNVQYSKGYKRHTEHSKSVYKDGKVQNFVEENYKCYPFNFHIAAYPIPWRNLFF